MVWVLNILTFILLDHSINFSFFFSEDKIYCNEPWIFSKTDEFGIEGQSLEFVCQSECVGKQDWKKEIDYEWKYNNTAKMVGKCNLSVI